MLGCIIGLISFSKLLNWLFKKAHNLTIAILTGFLIGSLNKIWPWKETTEFFVKHAGTPEEEIIPLVQHNIGPQVDSQLLISILLALAGFLFILAIDYLGNKMKN